MQTLSRRDLLKGAAVAAPATLLPALAAAVPAGDDAELLARVAVFRDACAQLKPVRAACNAAYEAAWEQAEAEGLFPLPEGPHGPRWERFQAIRAAHGSPDLYDAQMAAARAMREAAAAVFALPARTLPGVLAKLEIVRLAYGDGDGTGDADILEAQPFEDDETWLDLVLAALRRVAGGTRS